LFFGYLTDRFGRKRLFVITLCLYLVAMIAAGIAEWFIGVEAAGRSLEDVARPLTAEEEAEAPAA
jgi:MFS family permease